jgi:hypothetical protein
MASPAGVASLRKATGAAARSERPELPPLLQCKNGRRSATALPQVLFAAVASTALLFGGCSHTPSLSETMGGGSGVDDPINVYPANYKPDILGAMHVYLNDPTGIRDAAIAAPAVKSIGGAARYVVCVRFNPKKSADTYAGVKELAAIFMAGRFDRFAEIPAHRSEHNGARDNSPCAGATYEPFPELEQLPR